MIINALSPTSKSQCFSLALTGDLTGFVSMADNFMKFKQNPSQNWWNGIEASGQLILWGTGLKEAELIFNLSTMTIDSGIGLYNYYNSPTTKKK